MAATDLERARAAAELHTTVDSPLRDTPGRLAVARSGMDDAGAGARLDAILSELEAAAHEIADLVVGVPPADLAGRLGDAMRSLARRSSMPVPVAVDEIPDGDPRTFAALYYVAAEALANATKHSRAVRSSPSCRPRGKPAERYWLR